MRHHSKEIFPVGEALNSFHDCLDGTSVFYSLQWAVFVASVTSQVLGIEIFLLVMQVVLLTCDGGGSHPFPQGFWQRALATCILCLPPRRDDLGGLTLDRLNLRDDLGFPVPKGTRSSLPWIKYLIDMCNVFLSSQTGSCDFNFIANSHQMHVYGEELGAPLGGYKHKPVSQMTD